MHEKGNCMHLHKWDFLKLFQITIMIKIQNGLQKYIYSCNNASLAGCYSNFVKNNCDARNCKVTIFLSTEKDDNLECLD